MTTARTSLLRKTFTIAALLVSTLAATGSADAALISEIRVTSTNHDFIQIGELVATENGTERNVATGGTASSNGQWSAISGPEKAIDGVINQIYSSGIFHSGYPASSNDFLDIQLNGAFDLSSVTIYGRSDCCTERNVFDVSFLNAGTLVFFQSRVAASGSPSFSATVELPAAVPEPTSVALLGLGLLGFAAARRKSAESKNA